MGSLRGSYMGRSEARIGDAIRGVGRQTRRLRGTTLRLHVDLEEPEIKLEINLRPEGTYLFVQRVPGAGGLPSLSQASRDCPPFQARVVNPRISTLT